MSQPPPAERPVSSGSAAAVHEVVVDDDARFELKTVALPPKARVTLSAHTLAQFHEQGTFETEKAAYLRIARVGDLRGRVPDFRSAYDDPEHPALLLQRLHGSSLGHVLPTLSQPACDELQSELFVTLMCLHGAGVCHGKVSEDNIIVQDDGKPWLVDFSLAKLEHRCAPDVWEQEKRADFSALVMVFLRDTWAKAEKAAHGLLDDAEASGASVAHDRLIGHLRDIHEPSDALLARILLCVEPCPHLAVALDRYLSRRFGHASAARMLGTCIMRHEISLLLSRISFPSSSPLPPGPASNPEPTTGWLSWLRVLPFFTGSPSRGGVTACQVEPLILLELKMRGARRTALAELLDAQPAFLSTRELYKLAIVELARCLRSPRDEHVLELRYELALHLQRMSDPLGVLEECIDALEIAMDGGRDGEATQYEVAGELQNLLMEVTPSPEERGRQDSAR